MSNLTKIEQAFINTPDTVYSKLLTCAFFQSMIMYSSLSQTLVNNNIRNIINTRNRKFKRRYVIQLVNYLDTHTKCFFVYAESYITNNSFLSILWCLIHKYTEQYKSKDTGLPDRVRVLTIDNSPWYTAAQIGDSLHYSSCLRVGIRYKSDKISTDVTEYTDKDWEELVKHGVENYRGCNYSYIKQEVATFKSGEIIYAGIGTLPHEGGDGWLSRVRVHVCKNDDETLYVVDRHYGCDRYLPGILKVLEEHYGKLYSNPRVDFGDVVDVKFTSNGYDVSDFLVATGVYSDYTFDNVQQICAVNVATSIVTRTGYTFRVIVPGGSINVPKHALVKLSQSKAIRNGTHSLQSSSERIVPSTVGLNSLIHYICTKYNKSYTITGEYDVRSNWLHESKLVTNVRLRWKFRGCYYLVTPVMVHTTSDYSYKYVLLKYSDTSKYIYNIPRAKWENYNAFSGNIGLVYCLTRHTCHILDKFLPKHEKNLKQW